jgi:hypothetical protein
MIYDNTHPKFCIRSSMNRRMYGEEACLEHFGKLCVYPAEIAEWKDTWAESPNRIDNCDRIKAQTIAKEQEFNKLEYQRVGRDFVFLYEEDYITFKILYS